MPPRSTLKDTSPPLDGSCLCLTANAFIQSVSSSSSMQLVHTMQRAPFFTLTGFKARHTRAAAELCIAVADTAKLSSPSLSARANTRHVIANVLHSYNSSMLL